MRAILGAAVFCLVACGGKNNGDDGDDTNMKPDACVGLECAVVNCGAMQKPPTSISGTVFAPNGTLPLYGISVYVPREDPGPIATGLQCSRCSDTLPGSPIRSVQTDETGKFKLDDVPTGDNIPLVITSGKWRRQIVIPHIDQCVDTPLTAQDTRLPKTKAEGDIPNIAITTGNADSLECLIRKLGVADSEIATSGGAGKIHLYAGNGVAQFKGGFPGGTGAISSATPMWNTVDSLKQYDIVILSCEGAQNPNTKSQAALDAMKGYADAGGRVFMSHWHNIWVEGSTEGGGNQKPAVWPGIASWSNGGNTNDPTINLIDEVSNPKGSAFATWMQNVMGSVARDEINLVNGTGRTTCTQVDTTKGERWTFLKGQGGSTQNFQFTTPNEVAADQRCGKVVFSDMHVSGGPVNGQPYPDSCQGGANNLTLTAQEKALAFMFFDIASCVGSIF